MDSSINQDNKSQSGSFIIGKVMILEGGKRIRIINSYEKYLRDSKNKGNENYYNEKEIQSGVKIIIDDKPR